MNVFVSPAQALSIFLPTVVFSLVAFALYIPLARAFSWVAKPRSDRWQGNPNKPILYGGVVVFASFCFGVWLTGIELHWTAILGASGIFLVGLIDDILQLPPSKKALLLIPCTIALTHNLPLALPPEFNTLGYVASFLVAFVLQNSFNMCDNMDGASGSIAITLFISIALIASVLQIQTVVTLSIVAVSSLLLFTILNYYPAKMYLGDCGSLFIGSVIGSCAIYLQQYVQQKHGSYHSLLFLLLLVGMPLFDTLYVFISRRLRSISILKGGTDHVSHTLELRGVTPRLIPVAQSGITLLCSLCAYRVSISSDARTYAFVAALCLVLALFGRYLHRSYVTSHNKQMHRP